MYLDVCLQWYDAYRKESVTKSFITGKTLSENGNDLDRMFLISSAITKAFHGDHATHTRYMKIGGVEDDTGGAVVHLSQQEQQEKLLVEAAGRPGAVGRKMTELLMADRRNIDYGLYCEAVRNLDRVNWKVNCILTHCAPTSIVEKLDGNCDSDWLTDFLEMVKQRCRFDYWFLGHYHRSCVIDDRFIIQWEQMVELEYE